MPIPSVLLIALLNSGPAALEYAPGYSLDDEWGALWRRVSDRTGRADPDGPIQQRFSPDQYEDYQLDLRNSEFPLGREHAFVRCATCARFSVNSLDEFELTNVTQLKAHTRFGTYGFFSLAFDRLETRETKSNLFSFEIGATADGPRGPFGGISFNPRWEKDDVDVQLSAGYRDDRYGVARVKFGAFDAGTNASYGLAEARGSVLPRHLWQREVPFGLSFDVQSRSLYGVRAEGYLGGLFPARTSYRHPREPEQDRQQRDWGLFSGALLEWQPFELPLHVGGSVLIARTATQVLASAIPEQDRTVEENTSQLMVYALATPRRGLNLEASVTSIGRPERLSFVLDRDRDRERKDEELLLTLRAMWMPTEVVGADLRLIRDVRRSEGPPVIDVNGINTRLVVRALLQFGEHVWVSFGVGWDLDPGEVGYDGGGGTFIVSY
jgi:hypothetical protein